MRNKAERPIPLWVGWIFVVLVFAIVYYLKTDVVPFTKMLSQVLASSGTFLILMSYLLSPISYYFKWKQSPRPFKKLFGVFGFSLVTVHAGLAINYFMRAGLVAENVLSITFGFISLFIFSLAAISSLKSVSKSLGSETWLKIQRTGYIALILAMLHFTIISEGYYLDSTIGSFIVTLASLILLVRVIRFFSDRKKK